MSRPRGPTVCAEPRCTTIVDAGVRCPTHTKGTTRLRSSPRAAGYDHRWDAASRAYLRAHPWCAWPACTAASAVTDHIDGLGPLGPRGFDPTNWQALCQSHHATKTMRHDGGHGRARTPLSARPPGWTGLGEVG
jgi:hypothetical protein